VIVWRSGLWIAIALLTQAATITITNEDLPRAPVRPGHTQVAPDATSRAWLTQINRQRAQQRQPALELDPGLSAAARRQADMIASLPVAQRQSIPAKRLLEAFWQAGAVDGNPTWQVVSQGATAPPGPWGGFRIGQALSGDLSHVGVGSVSRDGVRWTVFVVAKRRVQLAGVEAGLRQPYDRLYLRGRLLPGFVKPHLMLTRPDGHVTQIDLRTHDAHFEHLLELDGVKGRYMVEIMVDSRWGPAVAALFPVDVGTAFKPEAVAASVAADDRRLSLAELRRRMLDLINADRRRFQLAPVTLNETLNRMAQGHSEDMKRHGFFAHTSPTTGSLEDRARTIGIRPMTLGENIAVAASLAEAEEGLMASPAHRSMILDPQMTVVGLGIALSDPGQRGPARIWVTQNYGVRDPD
jgi:uncharacterized protein YkwD